MFALYYEQDDGRLTWIAACHDVRSARNLAQIHSAGSEQPVVCIFNDASGGTHRCGMFHAGREMMGSPYMDPSYHLPVGGMSPAKYS
jgi:hypothetical protein